MPKLFNRLDADKDGVGTVAEVAAYFTKAQQATAKGPGKGGQGKGKAKRPPAETEASKSSAEATSEKSVKFADVISTCVSGRLSWVEAWWTVGCAGV